MTTASRSLATALWRARFASGLPRPRYTTNWDTTRNRRAASIYDEALLLRDWGLLQTKI